MREDIAGNHFHTRVHLSCDYCFITSVDSFSHGREDIGGNHTTVPSPFPYHPNKGGQKGHPPVTGLDPTGMGLNSIADALSSLNQRTFHQLAPSTQQAPDTATWLLCLDHVRGS
eukprot:scpid98764/ scgid22883/ 